MRLNDALLRQRAPGFVTVALARLELTASGARLEVAMAGHPAPILAREGAAAPIGVIGTPLGIVDDPELPEVSVDLLPGDLVAFYTDGVTEAAAPRVLLDESDLAVLVAERAASGPAAVVELLELTAVELAEGAPRDDIAALALMLPRDPPAIARRFPATLHAARDVAEVLRPLAGDLGPELAADLRLLATELVANAVRHTGVPNGRLEVRVRLTGDVVHLSVIDDGPGFQVPARPLATPGGPGGWGLYLVDQCAARWGTERGERHCVWLELERRRVA
jgi:anti-sigma regulatory factor (Ser/Thr protein kinase)